MSARLALHRAAVAALAADATLDGMGAVVITGLIPDGHAYGTSPVVALGQDSVGPSLDFSDKDAETPDVRLQPRCWAATPLGAKALADAVQAALAAVLDVDGWEVIAARKEATQTVPTARGAEDALTWGEIAPVRFTLQPAVEA